MIRYISLLLFIGLAWGQDTIPFNWYTSIIGNSNDIGHRDMILDSYGNYILVGDIDWANVDGNNSTIIKLDSLGNVIQSISGINPLLYSVAETNQGYIFAGEERFDTHDRNVYIVHYNYDLEEISSLSFWQGDSAYANDIIQSSNGEFVITGGKYVATECYNAFILTISEDLTNPVYNIFSGDDLDVDEYTSNSHCEEGNIILEDLPENSGYSLLIERGDRYKIVKLTESLEIEWVVNTYNNWNNTEKRQDFQKSDENGYLLAGQNGDNDLNHLPIFSKRNSSGVIEQYNAYNLYGSSKVKKIMSLNSNGYLLGGSQWDPTGSYSTNIILLKVDSLGNELGTMILGDNRQNYNEGLEHIFRVNDSTFTILTSLHYPEPDYIFELGLLEIQFSPQTFYPKIDSISTQIVLEDSEPLNLTLSAIHPRNDSLTFNAVSNSSSGIVNIDSTMLIIEIEDDYNGIITITAYVYDSNNNSDSTSFYTIVTPINDHPQDFNLVYPTSIDTFSTNENSDTEIIFQWEESIDVDDLPTYTLTIELEFFNNLYTDIHENINDTSYAIFSQSLDQLLNALNLEEYTLNWYVKANDEEYTTFSDTGQFVLTRSLLDNFEKPIIPKVFALHQNYPNPFNPVTTLQYDLPENANVNITIYDMMGRQVKSLVNGSQTAGYKSTQWNATNDEGKPVSAGLYLYTIEAGKFRKTKKMVLLK